MRCGDVMLCMVRLGNLSCGLLGRCVVGFGVVVRVGVG